MAESNTASLIADRFRTNSTLGEGTYGVVYLAFDEREKAHVALKKFRSREPQNGIDFNTIQEIRILSGIDHANIVSFIGVYPWQGSLYIATEYLPLSLKHMTERTDGSILPFADIKCYMKMILEGVKHLHENYILHRDLKPDNIMISKDGVVKLIDFGLATDYPPDFGELHSQVATEWYRAPELCLGARYYGPAIDMWSVGCIFAEMFLGRPFLPGAGGDLAQLRVTADMFGAICWPGCDQLPGWIKVEPRGTPPALTKVFPALTGSLDAIDLIAKFFTLDPMKRISAADALDHAYFQNPPVATLPSDLDISQPLRKILDGKMAPSVLLGTGRPGTGLVGSHVKFAPGTALLRSQKPR